MKRGGSVIPKKMRDGMTANPEYSRCALQGILEEMIGPCGGRPTREHAGYYAGKKIQEEWAIPPICARHHGVDAYQDAGTAALKEIRLWVALNRATDEELAKFNRATPSFFFQRDRLNAKYGVYVAPPIPKTFIGMDLDVPGGDVTVFQDGAVPEVRTVTVRRKLTPEEEIENEAKRYARTNGCSLDEARALLTELA